MTKVVGVKFRQTGKIYYFDPLDFEIKKGDTVQVLAGNDKGKKGEVLEVISPKSLPRGKKPFIMARCLQGQDHRSFFGENLYINEYF